MQQPSNNSVLLVAGEASSAAYAIQLLKYWRETETDILVFGLGTQQMAEFGFDRLAKAEDVAVVGVAEVLSSLRAIRQAFKALEVAARERKPRVAILMDLPDFNLRLAKKLKQLGIPIVYYISPQVWIWRKGRVKLIRKLVDRMLVILPFEEKFYRDRGVESKFVGHPLLDEIRPEFLNREWQMAERQRYGISPKQFVLALMPGSRKREIENHLDIQIEVARRLKRENQDLVIVLLVAPTLSTELLQEKLKFIDFSIIVIKREPFEMIALADIVLAASGTATLMVALMRKPMVIMYIFSPVSAIIGRLIMKIPKFFGLSNIILDQPVSPELLQGEASVEQIVAKLKPLLEDEGARLKQKRSFDELTHKLGDSGATKRVAEEVKGFLK